MDLVVEVRDVGVQAEVLPIKGPRWEGPSTQIVVDLLEELDLLLDWEDQEGRP